MPDITPEHVRAAMEGLTPAQQQQFLDELERRHREAMTHTGPTRVTTGEGPGPSEYEGLEVPLIGVPGGPSIPVSQLEGFRKGLGRFGVGAAEVTRLVPHDVARAARKELEPRAGEQIGAALASAVPVAAATLAFPPSAGETVPAMLGREFLTNAALGAAESGSETTGALTGLGGAGVGLAGRGMTALAPAAREGANAAKVNVLNPRSDEQIERAIKVALDPSQEDAFLTPAVSARSLVQRAQERTKSARARLRSETGAVANQPVSVSEIRDRIQGAREGHEVVGGAPYTAMRAHEIRLANLDPAIQDVINEALAKGQFNDAATALGITPREVYTLARGGVVTKVVPVRVAPQVAHPSRSSHGALSQLENDLTETQVRQADALARKAGVPTPTTSGGKPIPAPEVDFRRLYGYEKDPQLGGRAGLLPQYDEGVRQYEFRSGGPAAANTSQAALKEQADILRGSRNEQFPKLEPAYRNMSRSLDIENFALQRQRGSQVVNRRQLFDAASSANQGLRLISRPGGYFYAVPIIREVFASTPWNTLSAATRIRIANALEHGSPEEALRIAGRGFADMAAKMGVNDQAAEEASQEDRRRLAPLKE